MMVVMRPRAPRTRPAFVFRWQVQLVGIAVSMLGALGCGRVTLSQPEQDASLADASPADAAAAADAARTDASTPGPCEGTGGFILGCACSDGAQCASGHCIAGRCCEDACDDGCASCNAEGLCEPHPGRLRVSASPDRAGAVPLAGQSIDGTFYAFAETCEPVDEVRFFYDSSGPLHTDPAPPYDFGGGTVEAAGYHANIEFPKGMHALEARLVRGEDVVATLRETFVMEPSPFDETLLYSLEPLRSDPLPLEGATLSGEVYMFLAPGPMPTNRIEILFFVDGNEVRSETNPPYDLGGGNATAFPFDTADLTNGPHELETVYVVDGDMRSATARFDVAN